MKPLDVFIARWAAKVTTPFVPTINVQVDTDTLPDVWGSAQLQSETRQDVTFGSLAWVEERGIITVGLFARSGTGPNVLDAAIDEVRAAFAGYGIANDEVIYTGVDGPMDIDETVGEWWRMALNVPYVAQSQRVQPPAA